MSPTEQQIGAWRQALAGTKGEEMPDWTLAIVYLIVKELNALRALHGLPPRTADQAIAAIKATMGDFTVDP